MAHNELEGNVIGEVWRAQESDKELVYFRVEGEPKWYRIEYTGPEMLERADYMVQKLKAAAGSGSGIEVGIDSDVQTRRQWRECSEQKKKDGDHDGRRQ